MCGRIAPNTVLPLTLSQASLRLSLLYVAIPSLLLQHPSLSFSPRFHHPVSLSLFLLIPTVSSSIFSSSRFPCIFSHSRILIMALVLHISGFSNPYSEHLPSRLPEQVRRLVVSGQISQVSAGELSVHPSPLLCLTHKNANIFFPIFFFLLIETNMGFVENINYS